MPPERSRYEDGLGGVLCSNAGVSRIYLEVKMMVRCETANEVDSEVHVAGIHVGRRGLRLRIDEKEDNMLVDIGNLWI